MSSNKGNPIVIAISLLLTVIVFASFLFWWQEFRQNSASWAFIIFAWSLTMSELFLLLTRAIREWSDRR
jgi:hypothetical protein